MFEIGGKQIAASLAEIVAPKHSALLIWDMEYAIGPNAFNYKDILANLKSLSARAREAGVPVLYSVQTGFDLMKEEASGMGKSPDEARQGIRSKAAVERKGRPT
jgi:isochorismate hydrolase